MAKRTKRKAKSAAKTAAPKTAKRARRSKGVKGGKAAAARARAPKLGGGSYGGESFRCYGLTVKLRNKKMGPRGFCARVAK